jgi:hypothetical protein
MCKAHCFRVSRVSLFVFSPQTGNAEVCFPAKEQDFVGTQADFRARSATIAFLQ